LISLRDYVDRREGDPVFARRSRRQAAWAPAPNHPTARCARRAVGAARILSERVTVSGERPRARAAAEIAPGTCATASLELGGTDLAQQRMVAIDRDDVVLAHVAEFERQEPGRGDRAIVADEDHAATVARPLRLRARGPRRRAELFEQLCTEGRVDRAGRRAPGFALRDHTAEERSFDCADDQAVAGGVDEEMADLLADSCVELGEVAAAPGADEEEELPDLRARLAR
jgi:hypothetical protein